MRLAPNGFASRSAASSSGATLVAGISNGTKAAVGALFIVLIPAAANQRLLQHRETARNIVRIGMLFCDEITLRRDFCVNEIFQMKFLRMHSVENIIPLRKNMSDDSNAFAAQK
jgi:hypothetical protein